MPARLLDEMHACRTRAYLLARNVEYSSLPPSSASARGTERIVAAALLRTMRREAASRLIAAYDGTRDDTGPLYVEAAPRGRRILVGMKPDAYLVLATSRGLRGYVVEIAATRPARTTLRRLAPRILLYRLYLEQCMGPRSLAIYASTVPGEPLTVLTVADPAAAARLLHSRLEAAARLLEAETPPPPGRPSPPCGECGYRTICPYARSQG